ncbi:Flp pilus assembly protein CpaB [Pseudooceanicola sp. LIPI14-2-Ac024]|uniref:Flp pilus assembly protein CpaB n=1 Tax=Pseudooceanicola sp. LIPI14-2-Ac024 TaxID=3344875 RepID=UPI0035CFBE7E
MQFKSLATILLGTALAGAGSFAAMNLAVGPDSATAMPDVEMIDVVVAQAEIPFGQAIEPTMLTTQSWPRSAMVPGLYTRIDAVTGEEPRRALGRIFPGEPILAAKLSAPGERVTIVQKLTPGHRAMAINVDAATAVGGFVTPGDRVDIVMTEGNGAEMRAVTVLQNVRVVGIDQIAEEQQDQPMVARTITVEVSPEEGQKLALAQRAGRLSLSLREADAPDLEPLKQINLADLFDTPEPEPEVAPEPEIVVEVQAEPVAAPRRPSVIVRRGTVAEEVFLK